MQHTQPYTCTCSIIAILSFVLLQCLAYMYMYMYKCTLMPDESFYAYKQTQAYYCDIPWLYALSKPKTAL